MRYNRLLRFDVSMIKGLRGNKVCIVQYDCYIYSLHRQTVLSKRPGVPSRRKYPKETENNLCERTGAKKNQAKKRSPTTFYTHTRGRDRYLLPLPSDGTQTTFDDFA